MHKIKYRELVEADLDAIFEAVVNDYHTQAFEYINKLQSSFDQSLFGCKMPYKKY